MRKINLIFILVIVNVGCSITKYSKDYNNDLSGGVKSAEVLERVKQQNISSFGFFIQKAAITVLIDDVEINVIGSIKFQKPDKYLFSIRSKAGIEVIRVFVSKDTILINDRVNKKQYYGSVNYVKNKFGFTSDCIPILFGDFIADINSASSTLKCYNDKIENEFLVSGILIKYIIDCKRGKTVSAIPGNVGNNGILKLSYNKFIKVGVVSYPKEISVLNFKENTKIQISIERIEIPWDGDIEFIPGNKYEQIELL